MNKKPVSYKQYDARWGSKPYRVPGESSTIKSAGCGPTSAAMLIETITGKKYTPEDACAWSVAHGYKALKHGTAYAYFKPQFAAFGIECDMLNWQKTYGKPDHQNHQRVLELLKQGYYIIALMGPGTWTTSGHFVVVWWMDGKIRINDPASARTARENGDPKTFFSQVNYYWWVDARDHNATVPTTPDNNTKEDIDMDEVKKLIEEAKKEILEAVAPKRYNTVAEIEKELPWAAATIYKMIGKGYLRGSGGKRDEAGYPADMNLTVDMIREFTINDRAGLYDK